MFDGARHHFRDGIHRLQAIRSGIAGRLGLSFVAMTLLAVLANLIALQGGKIVHTTSVRAVAVAPVPALRPATRVAPAVGDLPRAELLLLAMDRFERAALLRAQHQDMEATGTFDATGGALDLAVRTFAADFRRFSGVLTREFSTDFDGYRRAAQKMIDLSDQRRARIAGYSVRLETMTARMKKSLDSAFKIFGRIIARESLINLRDQLDEIARHLGAADTTIGVDSRTMTALSGSEAQFRQTLNGNAASLRGSQGQDWVNFMADGVVALEAERLALGSVEAELRSIRNEIAVFRERIQRSSSALQARAVAAATAQAREAERAAAAAVDTHAANTSPATATAAPAFPDAPITTVSDTPPERSLLLLISTVSASLVLLVLVLSIHTVRSIVHPIRALVAASRRVARDETVEPIANAGIAEIDTLSGAFNHMATELARNRARMRNHQAELETSVEERTQ